MISRLPAPDASRNAPPRILSKVRKLRTKAFMTCQAFQLEPGHYWKARPGHRILIVDNGAVRFDFPRDWTLYSRPAYACLLDKTAVDYSCAVTVSAKRLPISTAPIPLEGYLREIAQTDDLEEASSSDAVRIFRPPLEAGWVELRFMDPVQRREARKRVCIARAGLTRAVITFDFWPEDELRHFWSWNTILETLVVGDYIEDPLTGRRREQRG